MGEYPHSHSTSPVHKLYNAVSYNMCTFTLYNMVNCPLQSLAQSTTDNYQLLTLKHCISLVNTHTHTHAEVFYVHTHRTVSVSQCPEQWQRGDECNEQFTQLTLAWTHVATPEATSSLANHRQILRAKTQHGLARLNGVGLEGCHKQQGLLHIQSHFDTGVYS